MHFSLPAILIFLTFNLQAQTLRTEHDLDFKKYNRCHWDWFLSAQAYDVRPDSDGLAFTSLNNRGSNSSISLYKEIILPAEQINEIELRLYARAASASPLPFKLECFDQEGKRIANASETFMQNDAVKAIRMITKNLRPKFIAITIEAKKDDKETALYILNRIELWLNGSNANDKRLPVAKVEKEGLDKTKFVTSTDQLVSSVLNKKDTPITIVGLGENTHGSKTIAENRISLLKNLIMNGGCRLVGYELNYDIGILFDLYVQGGKVNKNIVEGYAKGSFDYEVLFPFLEWLRAYNIKTKGNPVHLVGMDNNNPSRSVYALLDICEQILAPEEIDPFFASIMARKFAKLASLFREKETVKSKIDKETINYIVSILEKLDATPELTVENRDSLMFERFEMTKACYLKPNERAAILAHSGHLQKIDARVRGKIIMPLGAYLSNQYHAQYSVVNFTFGEGGFIQDSCAAIHRLFVDHLTLVPQNSFEALANKMSLDTIVCPTDIIPESIQTALIIPRNGNEHSNFHYTSLRNRFDYIAFTKTSEPFAVYHKDKFQWGFALERERRERFKGKLVKYGYGNTPNSRQ